MMIDDNSRFRQDFRHGNGVKFKCVASIYDAYYKVEADGGADDQWCKKSAIVTMMICLFVDVTVCLPR